MKPIAFVTPWYGENISGGAEAELRGLVQHLQNAGVELEVLTTCVREFLSDWNKNYHKASKSICNNIPVRRFLVRKRHTKVFDEINAKLMLNQKISLEEEEIYQQEMINSPQLYKYIRENKEKYALFVFIPYMFGTTYYGVQECLEKAVLIPCLHDESYAYMQIFKEVFSKTRGMIFHSEPERKLAENLYGVTGWQFSALGGGVDTEAIGNPARFRAKYQLNEPFILYAGRKDAGKRVDTLIAYFSEYKKKNPSDLKLVLIGGGSMELPKNGEIIDLGFVPVQDKYDAYAAADIFCNPSEFESFSLVIMESWLAERPVLVNGDCAVTKDFVIKSNAGLYYQNYLEFAGCVQYLLEHTDVACQMGRNGREYVLKNFAWDIIVKKYIDYFQSLESEITE